MPVDDLMDIAKDDLILAFHATRHHNVRRSNHLHVSLQSKTYRSSCSLKSNHIHKSINVQRHKNAIRIGRMPFLAPTLGSADSLFDLHHVEVADRDPASGSL